MAASTLRASVRRTSDAPKHRTRDLGASVDVTVSRLDNLPTYRFLLVERTPERIPARRDKLNHPGSCTWIRESTGLRVRYSHQFIACAFSKFTAFCGCFAVNTARHRLMPGDLTHRAPLALRSIMTLRQPTAFLALTKRYDGKCPSEMRTHVNACFL
jgi:hypothetical protein